MTARRVQVRKDAAGDWVMTCDTHYVVVTTDCQAWAYEAAMGHLCMEHPRRLIPQWAVDYTKQRAA